MASWRPGATSIVLSGVSCTSATACTAVGYIGTPHFAHLPLAEAWNGTTWVIQATPSPLGATSTRGQPRGCGLPACG